VVFFGALAIVVVTATTAILGREWQFQNTKGPGTQEPPVRQSEPPVQLTLESLQNTRYDEETEEKDGEVDSQEQENLNVLHLLYTIAQVVSHLVNARIKPTKTGLCIGGYHVISVVRNRFEVCDITV
jgi:hypothetical protein